MVFRRLYGEEIDRVSVGEIDDDFKRELTSLKGQLSVQKGDLAEHRVRYRGPDDRGERLGEGTAA